MTKNLSKLERCFHVLNPQTFLSIWLTWGKGGHLGMGYSSPSICYYTKKSLKIPILIELC